MPRDCNIAENSMMLVFPLQVTTLLADEYKISQACRVRQFAAYSILCQAKTGRGLL
ncbi:hypothetical protein KIMH_06130 [Bombiscardovia apis]|uniref:Uncharacterized protein n=1 Tax=Bombiscardovia apis TaxID=2932182 RepID=A0ABM8BCT9_9BIFI|nr:hypothetical protein KIMH_06130 [Bombiscardovia apis]